MNFINFFESRMSYAKHIAINILPIGTLHQEMPSSLLEAFVNFVTIKSAWCLNTLDVPHVINVDTLCNFDENEERRNLSCSLSNCHDIVVILGIADDWIDKHQLFLNSNAKADANGNYRMFWFFLFEDKNFCKIGRFITSFDVDTVTKLFDDYVHELNVNLGTTEDVIGPINITELIYDKEIFY